MTKHNYSVFSGARRCGGGALAVAALAARRALDAGETNVLVFEDATGQQTDLDLSGDAVDIAARYHEASALRPRGRPRLGVTAHEVTLLPEQWSWLARQPGGASATLRKLVLSAQRETRQSESSRESQEACYRFLTALAGNFPHYETVLRALFKGDRDRFASLMESWPEDVKAYALQLASPAT